MVKKITKYSEDLSTYDTFITDQYKYYTETIKNNVNEPEEKSNINSYLEIKNSLTPYQQNLYEKYMKYHPYFITQTGGQQFSFDNMPTEMANDFNKYFQNNNNVEWISPKNNYW